jgi:hypothetical protein
MPWCPSRDELPEETMESADRLRSRSDQLITPIRQRLQRHVLIVGTDHPQPTTVQGRSSDRHRVGLVGLGAMASRIHPDPGGQLGGHINNRLTRSHQTLGDATADTVRSLHRPDPVTELPHGLQHQHQPIGGVLETTCHMNGLIMGMSSAASPLVVLRGEVVLEDAG